MKILIISLAGIGDTFCAIPLIDELKRKIPNSKIDVLVMWEGSKQILENNPNINKIYQFNMLEQGILKSLLFLFKLKRNKYDVSINTYPQSKIQYRIVSKIINSKKRIGHIYDNYCFLDKFLLTDKINQDYNLHFIENNLNLLKPLKLKLNFKKHNYKIYFSKLNKENAKKFIIENNLKDKELFGVSIGSGKTKNLELRRWPLKYYEELIKKILIKNKNIIILLFGGPNEIQDNLLLKKNLRNKRVLIVQTPQLLDSAVIIKKCKFFISVDNVMMHFASAVKVPYQIVIQTPTLNKTSEPYNKYILIKKEVPKNLIYKYGGKGIKGGNKNIIKYMKSIKPEEVFNKIKKFI